MVLYIISFELNLTTVLRHSVCASEHPPSTYCSLCDGCQIFLWIKDVVSPVTLCSVE